MSIFPWTFITSIILFLLPLILPVGIYFFFLQQRPYLYFRGEEISRFFEKSQIAVSVFSPTFWLCVPGLSGVLSTVFAWGIDGSSHDNVLWNQASTDDDDVLLETVANHGGAEVGIAWSGWEEGRVKNSSLKLGVELTGYVGVLVIVRHGLGGSLEAGLVDDLKKRAFGVWLISEIYLPGVGGTKGWSGAGLSVENELQAATEKISAKIGGSHIPKVIVAFGLGGTALLNFLGGIGSNSYQAAAVISPALQNLDTMMLKNNPVTRWLLTVGKSFLKDNADFINIKHPDVVHACLASDHLQEFYSNLYDKAFSSNTYGAIDALAIPTLFILSRDDPFVDWESVDLLRLIKNKHVAVSVTERGGYCGFLHGMNAERWCNALAIDFLTLSTSK